MNQDNDSIKSKIDALEASINSTNQEFRRKISGLKTELSSLRQLVENKTSAPVTTPIKKPETKPISKAIPQIAPLTQSIDSKPRLFAHSEALSLEDDEIVIPEQVQKSHKPGFIITFLTQLFQSLFGGLLSSLTQFSSPFHALYLRFSQLYSHYQEQGKAPVFLMTLAGLISLTVGFSYLLQYSFNHLFNDTLKSITGFVIGTAIIFAGILLARKKADYSEYTASVIALGIIFNYLTAYFIGPYYGMIEPSTSLLLLLGITFASFSLSLLFETRVVAVITLIGGLFMPFIIGDADSAGLVFLIYLFVLSMANLFLANKIKWPLLAQLSFILSLSVIEYIGINQAVNSYTSIAIMSAFFYVYTYFWSFDGIKLKDIFLKQDLTILTANLFYFIYVMLNLNADHLLLTAVFASHAVILIFIMRLLRLMNSIVAPIFILMIGLMIAAAVFVLAPTDISNIIWALEGLVMLYIGFNYKHKIIRSEGYVIYVAAMLSLLWHAIDAFLAQANSTIAWHWINLIAFGILSFIAYRIIYYYKAQATPIEQRGATIQNEIFSFWGAITLSLVLYSIMPGAITVLAIVPMLWSFYRVAKHQLKLAQITGYCYFAAFIWQITLPIITTNNSSSLLLEQSMLTWIALIELLSLSWLMHFFYRYYHLDGWGKSLAKQLNIAFYYAPFVLIVIAIYNLFKQYIYAQNTLEFGLLWLDFILIAGIIALAKFLIIKTTQYETTDTRKTVSRSASPAYIIDESLSLFISLFFLYTATLLFSEWAFNLAIIPMLYLLHRGIKNNLKLTEILAWLHFTLFAIMVWISYQAVGNFHFSEQASATMIGWAEILLSAWLMQMVYERAEKKQGVAYQFSCSVRTVVYLLIPLLFLPRVFRLYTEFLPVALWLSFVISWIFHKKLSSKKLSKETLKANRLCIPALLHELTILFFVAIAMTITIALQAINGSNEMPGLIALIAGFGVMTLFNAVEDTLSLNQIKASPYALLMLISPYFYGLMIIGFSYALFHQVAISLVMSGLFFLFILQSKQFFTVMRHTLNIAYAISWLVLLSLPALIFSQSITTISLLSGDSILIVGNLVSLAGIGFLTHYDNTILHLLRRKFTSQNIQHWLFHGSAFLVYMGILNTVFRDWSVAISIAMLIHAVILLSLTLIEKYAGLIRLSVILYALTAAKVMLHDMQDFSNLHKIIALMGIGSILMAAAYFFQSIKNKSEGI